MVLEGTLNFEALQLLSVPVPQALHRRCGRPGSGGPRDSVESAYQGLLQGFMRANQQSNSILWCLMVVKEKFLGFSPPCWNANPTP